MQPECRQHPTAQPEGLSKDYSTRYSRGMLSLSNYGPYKPCNPWHLSAGLVMLTATYLQLFNSTLSLGVYLMKNLMALSRRNEMNSMSKFVDPRT